MHSHDEHFDRAHGRVDRAQDRMWRKMEAMGRRGWGGWGGGPRGFGGAGGPGGPGRGGFGDWGGFGDNFRIGRMLASGDLRLVALYFIEQQPRHGYDLIKVIEEKTGGMYSPSPGVIYPALTFLEEANYVASVAEANKRLYTITDEGRAHLNDNREAVETTLAHLGQISEQFGKMRERWEEMRRHFDEHHPPRPDRDMDDVEPAVNDARRELKDAIKQAARNRDPENQRRLADVLRRAADEIRRGSPQDRPNDDVDL
jgi:DNA-binding PadR family transcriptional regulator